MAIPVLNDLNITGNVRTGTTSLTANTNFDNLVIEGSAHTGITIFSGTSSDGAIYFGDATATDSQGQIKYLHSSNTMTFATNDGSASLTLNADSSATFAGSIDTASIYNTALKVGRVSGGEYLDFAVDGRPMIVVDGTEYRFNSAAFVPGTDNVRNLGSSVKQWHDLHLGGDLHVAGSILPSAATGATKSGSGTLTHTMVLATDDNFHVEGDHTETTNLLALTVASSDVGKSGVITLLNSGGTTTWSALPSNMLTPGGATLNFVTTANAISVISYYVYATDKVLVNYVGNFA